MTAALTDPAPDGMPIQALAWVTLPSNLAVINLHHAVCDNKTWIRLELPQRAPYRRHQSAASNVNDAEDQSHGDMDKPHGHHKLPRTLLEGNDGPRDRGGSHDGVVVEGFHALVGRMTEQLKEVLLPAQSYVEVESSKFQLQLALLHTGFTTVVWTLTSQS